MSEKLLLAGVIGNPIAHSKSPLLHMHWMRRHGLHGHYVPLKVEPATLETVLDALPKMGFFGVNVTLPYKEDALRLAKSASDQASLIGAANTLTFLPSQGFHADNTDGSGFIQNVLQHVPDWQPSRAPAAVIGAGGASRAIVCALLSAGVPEVRVMNRTKARAENLRTDFGARLSVVEWSNWDEILSGAGLLVNTTSLGMVGKPPLKISLSALSSDCVVTDIVYTPIQTPLLHDARLKGCRTVDGLGMLLHQAVPAFERWFGISPKVDDELRNVILSS